MSGELVREKWKERQAYEERRAAEFKSPVDAMSVMAAYYRVLPQDEREVVDSILASDLESESAGVRAAAQWLIDELEIGSAIPALRKLADRLEGGPAPWSTDEWEMVNLLVARLNAKSGEANSQ